MALAVGAFVAFLAGGRQPMPDANAASRGPGSPLTLSWGGDVTLGSRYGNPPDHARAMLAAVAPIMRTADVAAVNLEGTLGAGGTSKCPPPPNASPNCFAFQAPAENAEALPGAGVDIVNLANNHAWDFGAIGMGRTITALRRQHVAFTGRPGEIAYRDVHGARVAFLGFSSYPWTSPIRDPAAIRRFVAQAARTANVVVVFMHAGAEGVQQTHTPDTEEQAFGELRGNARAFAHLAIDAGADVVLGSGPHVLRGMEVYRGRLVAYSLGNLAGYRNFAQHGALAVSALLRVDLAADGALAGGHLVSLKLIGPGTPTLDPAASAVQLVGGVTAADFGRRGAQLSPSGQILGPFARERG
jgi:Bacterial capsule synthesis protein PGA_cap